MALVYLLKYTDSASYIAVSVLVGLLSVNHVGVTCQ